MILCGKKKVDTQLNIQYKLMFVLFATLLLCVLALATHFLWCSDRSLPFKTTPTLDSEMLGDCRFAFY